MNNDHTTEVKQITEPLTITVSAQEWLKDSELIKKQAGEIDRLNGTILKGSILYQKTKSFLDAEVQEVKVSHAFIDKFLDELEGIFDSTGKLSSPEIAVDYLAAARHREKQGRHQNRIVDIQNWLDQ